MKKPLKKIYIEITNLCNLKCSFCSQSQRKGQNMKSDDFRRIVEQIEKYTDYVHLHVKGEPLVHPELGEILEICGEHNIKVNITTNGTLLLKKLDVLKMHKSLRQVNISLHAETDDPERYFNECVEAGNILAKAGVFVSYRLWNGEGGLVLKQKLFDLYPENYVKGNRITLSENTFLSLDEFWEWPQLTLPYIGDKGICNGLRHHIGILVDGTVIPCCLDGEGQASLGNVFEKSFDEIWEENISLPRQNMYNRKLCLELCKHCSYREKFQ
ncbi:MAG: radical SAM protein [Clostridia bacterium]|nr:radical SAM protein [Clostridia bacterium]